MSDKEQSDDEETNPPWVFGLMKYLILYGSLIFLMGIGHLIWG